MHIGIPQAIYLALMFISIGMSIVKFGEPKSDTYGWFEVLIGPSIGFGLLYWGGFFG